MYLYTSYKRNGFYYTAMKLMKNWREISNAVTAWLDFFSDDDPIGDIVFTVVYQRRN